MQLTLGQNTKDVSMEGGLKPPLVLDILQKLYYLRKGIICFRILFAWLFVDLMQIPRNQSACKFQGTL